MEGLIVFLTEMKMGFKNKKDELFDWLDDISYSVYSYKNKIKSIYDEKYSNKVNRVIEYFNTLSKDVSDAASPLYNYIWDHSMGRVLGYIFSVVISFLILLVTTMISMLGASKNILLFSLIPVSLIPIDVAVFTILFVSKRVKRLYNHLLKRMKNKYGVHSDKDLVNAYKIQKGIEEEKQVVKEQEAKKTVTVEKKVESNELSDSAFLEKMFGFVSSSKYVAECDRESFLDEINLILDKYSKLKKENNGISVNEYLQSDIQHLQCEYERYLSNTQSYEENNDSNYILTLK